MVIVNVFAVTALFGKYLDLFITHLNVLGFSFKQKNKVFIKLGVSLIMFIVL